MIDMLKFFTDISDAFWDCHSQETQQMNADIKILSALFKEHFDLSVSSCKSYIQLRDVKAMRGIGFHISNDSLSVDAFKVKLEHVKEIVHTVLPGKFFDELRNEITGSISAAFTLQIEELSLLNKQLQCQFQPRAVALGK
jgi:F0F1-type ATP synthase delta subunit